MSKLVLYIFVLIGIIVALVYYIGLKSDVNVIGANANTLIQALSGRQNNQFAAYPTGG